MREEEWEKNDKNEGEGNGLPIGEILANSPETQDEPTSN